MTFEELTCKVCGKEPRYLLQWLSYDEKGKYVLNAERAGCSFFPHLVEIIVNDNPNNEMPQGIEEYLDFSNSNQLINFDLMNLLQDAVNMRLNPEMYRKFCNQGQKIIDEAVIRQSFIS